LNLTQPNSWQRHFLHTRCNGYTAKTQLFELGSDIFSMPNAMVVPQWLII